MAKKASKAKQEGPLAGQWRRLLTPEALADYGALKAPRPKETFDPTGAWTQAWQVWLLQRSAGSDNHQGYIRLTRAPAPDGASFTLAVEQAVVQAQRVVHETRAKMVCALDATASPQSWTVETRLFWPSDGREVSEASVRKGGEVSNGRLHVKKDGRSRAEDLPPGAVSSNWSILEALSRPSPAAPLPAFTVLDELDKMKGPRRLTRGEATQIRFGDETVHVDVFRDTGHGSLPWVYYLDDNRRLLLALSGLRAYILCADVETRHRQALKALGRRRQEDGTEDE